MWHTKTSATVPRSCPRNPEINLKLSVATIAGALGVHGYRGRNRWCYLLHILLALFIALTFFALFIHSIVQFNAMHSNVNELNDKYEEAHKQTITPGGNQTGKNLDRKLTKNVDKKLWTYLAEELAASAAKEEFKNEKFDMDEIKTRLMFPVILFLVNIVVYLSSASFAWKSWQQLIDGSAGMSPFENEDDKPDSNPIE